MAKLKVEFSIQSVEDDLDNIRKVKDLIPVKPDRFWQKGDPITRAAGRKPKVLPRYKYSCWRVEEEYENVNDIKDGIIPILDRIWPHRKVIAEIGKNYDVEILVTVVPTIFGGHVPAFSLSSSILNQLVYLGAEIDFDIYFDDA